MGTNSTSPPAEIFYSEVSEIFYFHLLSFLLDIVDQMLSLKDNKEDIDG